MEVDLKRILGNDFAAIQSFLESVLESGCGALHSLPDAIAYTDPKDHGNFSDTDANIPRRRARPNL